MEASPLRTRCRVAVCWWSARSSPCPSQSPPAPSARRPGRNFFFFLLNGLLFCSVVDLDGSGLEFFLGSGSSKIGKEQKNKNFIYILGLWIRDCSTV